MSLNDVYLSLNDGLPQSEDGEIRNVHGIRCRRMGPYTLVDLHMQVDPLLSVSGAHQAEARVRRIIKAKVRVVCGAIRTVLLGRGADCAPCMADPSSLR